MATIDLLPDIVINQIAAGEIIERPASVVKELVENSIDAGASFIHIEIEDAGKRRIQITDNGSGMNRGNLEKSILRFATSKIRKTEDLRFIRSYGFRGEAIPSIASVSFLSIISCDPETGEAYQLEVQGGKKQDIFPSVFERGTKIIVENLFYNVPARLKFLKTNVTEVRKIYGWVESLALVHPEISFKLTVEEKDLLNVSRHKDKDQRLLEIYGADFVKQSSICKWEFENGKIWGRISHPSFFRRDRSGIKTFVNGRYVQNPILNYTISRFYKDKLPPSHFPVLALFIEIEPFLVDVNVHPAKLEIRFENEEEIVSSCLKGFSVAYANSSNIGNQEKEQEKNGLSILHKPDDNQVENRLNQKKIPVNLESLKEELFSSMINADNPKASKEEDSSFPAKVEDIKNAFYNTPRLIGQARQKYLILEMEGDLVILDQHAAHERVLYERTLNKPELITSQQLLMPEIFSFHFDDFEILHENKEFLNQLGFSLHEFGNNTLKIDAVPSHLKLGEDMKQYFQGLIAFFKDEAFGKPGWEKMVRGVCRQSVMFGDKLDCKEQEQLIKDLFLCENPFTCPHGRPVFIKIPFEEIDHKLGRK